MPRIKPRDPLQALKLVQLALDLFAPQLQAPTVPAPQTALSGYWQQPYVHAQATHQIALAGVPVAYALVRAKRRSVGFSVSAEGLCVRAPARVSVREIELLLRERADWICKHLHKQAQQLQHAPAPQQWHDGAELPFQGRMLRMVLDAVAKHSTLQLGFEQDHLQLALPLDASPARIEKAAIAWLRKQAQAVFAQRLAALAPVMGVRYSQIRLSNAKTRWGSASSAGVVTLHWRLVQLDPALMDYVLIHELAHLREMNHSPAFWAIVAQHCPDYLALRKRLRDLHMAAL